MNKKNLSNVTHWPEAAILVILTLGLYMVPAVAQENPFFEEGIVRAPSAKGEINAYPVVARTLSGNLFVAWSISGPGNTDGKIVGSVSRDSGRTWSDPITVIDVPKKFDGDPCIIIDGRRILVYSSSVIPPNKIDNSEVWMAVSENDGETWSAPEKIQIPFKYFVGKRHIGLKLKNGMLAMPGSYDLWAEKGTPAKTEGEMDLKSGVLLSSDGGRTWVPHIDLHISAEKVTPYSTGGVVEPAIVELSNGELYMLMRTGTENLYESRSKDSGVTWSTPRPSPLTAHNTPASLWRVDRNPREIIAVWNNSPRNRFPLSVAISSNAGRSWSRPKDIARSENKMQISYPGITQAADGNFVVVWQKQLPNGNGREIHWARFNRTWVLSK